MLRKGDKTRQLILLKSKQLFSDRGYATVTMKDICEACNLSRGGLYRHFGSTKDIFIGIMDEDNDEKRDGLEESISHNVPADQLLRGFLEDRKKTKMIGADAGLSFAIHEFFHTESDQQDYMRKRYLGAVEGLVIFFQYGQRQGIFWEFDPRVMAVHILLLLDSLEISSFMLRIGEEEIDRQFEVLYSLILADRGAEDRRDEKHCGNCQ